jgi:hypothetical protein
MGTGARECATRAITAATCAALTLSMVTVGDTMPLAPCSASLVDHFQVSFDIFLQRFSGGGGEEALQVPTRACARLPGPVVRS